MEKVSISAKAKINLTLDIVGRQGDYHILDMVVASISLADKVEIFSRNDSKCSCIMDGVLCDSTNSAIRACKMMQEQFKTTGFDIVISKKIPFSGGLGGSTADGVAVIAGIAKLLDINRKKISNEFLLKLGSDAPCMYDDGMKRVRGRGEIVDKLDFLPSYGVGIIAGTGVSTSQCYAKYDELGLCPTDDTLKLLQSLNKGEKEFYKFCSNALMRPSMELNPNIAQAVNKLKNSQAICVNMSGSGSAVYGLFDTDVPDEFISAFFV